MPHDCSFAQILARLRNGDREATAFVVARFARRLNALSNKQLDRRVRPKVDPEDVTQEVFENFFRRLAAGEFRLENWEGLWAVFSVIAMRRCAWEGRWYTAEKRDVRRETGHAGDSPSGIFSTIAAREDSPDDSVALAEAFDEAMNQMDSADRPVVSLALHGWSVAEIAARVGKTPRTVYRILERLRESLLAVTDASNSHRPEPPASLARATG
jgi:RNA polymerase sigma factor (sigma-70 family)